MRLVNWTQDRIDMLRQLCAAGLGDADIAHRLGGFEHCQDGGKNSVISKRHQLHIFRRATKIGGEPMPIPRKSPTVRAVQNLGNRMVEYRAPERPEHPAQRSDRAGGKSFAELMPADCKWPEGDVGHPDFYFCGDPRIEGLAYCAAHCRRAFSTVAERRREAAEFAAQQRARA